MPNKSNFKKSKLQQAQYWKYWICSRKFRLGRGVTKELYKSWFDYFIHFRKYLRIHCASRNVDHKNIKLIKKWLLLRRREMKSICRQKVQTAGPSSQRMICMYILNFGHTFRITWGTSDHPNAQSTLWGCDLGISSCLNSPGDTNMQSKVRELHSEENT